MNMPFTRRVVPAKAAQRPRAGIYDHRRVRSAQIVVMGPRFRGDDEVDWNPK